MAAQNDQILDTPSDIQLPFVQKPQIAGAQPAIIASIVVLGITPIGALPTDPIAGNKGLRCCFWVLPIPVRHARPIDPYLADVAFGQRVQSLGIDDIDGVPWLRCTAAHQGVAFHRGSGLPLGQRLL